jgi:hypothetical protein
MDDTDYNLKNIKDEYNTLSQYLMMNQNNLTRNQRKQIRERLSRLEELLEMFKRSAPPGAGIIRSEGKLRPSVLSLLKKVGDEKVTSLTIWRRILPYSKVVKFLSPDVAPDKIYHTSLNINGKYNLEKDGVSVVFTKGKPEGETLSVKVPSGSNLTIQELFDKTKKRMGDKDFADYNIEKLNCQNFVDNILSAIGLNSSEAKKFVNQDAEKVIESLGGKWVKALATVYQTVKEVADVVQEGGRCGCQMGMGLTSSKVAAAPIPRFPFPTNEEIQTLGIPQLNEWLTRIEGGMRALNAIITTLEEFGGGDTSDTIEEFNNLRNVRDTINNRIAVLRRLNAGEKKRNNDAEDDDEDRGGDDNAGGGDDTARSQISFGAVFSRRVRVAPSPEELEQIFRNQISIMRSENEVNRIRHNIGRAFDSNLITNAIRDSLLNYLETTIMTENLPVTLYPPEPPPIPFELVENPDGSVDVGRMAGKGYQSYEMYNYQMPRCKLQF